jgi:hypothetical protein
MARWGHWALAAARRVGAEPRAIGRVRGEVVFLTVAVVAQWVAVALLAGTAQHNGWLYYQGGDQTFFYTIGWILAHGHLPVTGIGYAWSLVEAPVAAVAGPSFLVALPGIVGIQVLLLLPLGLVAFYGTTKRFLGAGMARLGTVVWILAPYAVVPLFVTRYHARWVDQTLPQLLGLTGMGDFASMVTVLCAAYLLFRYLDEGAWETAALAGLVSGFAVGLKPSTALFLAGPVVGLAVARRFRGAGIFLLGLAPTVVTLALWKYRGYGNIPAFSSQGVTVLALGAPAGVVAVSGVHKYVNLDWHHLSQNLDAIREFFWSNRLVEWIPIAGGLGALRRSWAKGAFLIVWLAAYVVDKGTNAVVSVDTASFWRLLSPAWPAYLLLGLSIVTLVPTVGSHARPTAPALRPHAFRRTLWVAAAVIGLLPLVVVAALPRDVAHHGVQDHVRNLYIPVDPSFALDATVRGQSVRLTWRGPATGGVRPTYLVFRAPTTGNFPKDGLVCDTSPVPTCQIGMAEVGYHRSSYIDRPGPGPWVYRVAQAADYTGAEGTGDPLVLSTPVRVRVPAS